MPVGTGRIWHQSQGHSKCLQAQEQEQEQQRLRMDEVPIACRESASHSQMGEGAPAAKESWELGMADPD